jgi:hypothetical protein
MFLWIPRAQKKSCRQKSVSEMEFGLWHGSGALFQAVKRTVPLLLARLIPA